MEVDRQAWGKIKDIEGRKNIWDTLFAWRVIDFWRTEEVRGERKGIKKERCVKNKEDAGKIDETNVKYKWLCFNDYDNWEYWREFSK